MFLEKKKKSEPIDKVSESAYSGLNFSQEGSKFISQRSNSISKEDK